MTDTGTPTSTDAPRRAAFHAMTAGTQDDWNLIAEAAIHNFVGLPERLMAHLRLLDGDFGGFAVDRLTHSLQTAARAERAGRDDEYVFCALLHDIGDVLGPSNHADIAAAIVQPFVSPEYHWIVQQHAIFQGYYYFEYLGLDPNLREQFAGHEWFGSCAEFCHEYDQAAFDPSYDTPSLEYYEPLIRSVTASPKRSLYKRGE